METHVWSFFLIVALCSLVGYFLMKRYAAYYVNRKTQKMLEDFRRENGLETEAKPFSVVEKELAAAEKSARNSEKSAKPEIQEKEKPGELDE